MSSSGVTSESLYNPISAAAQLEDNDAAEDNTVFVLVTMLASIAIILSTGAILSAAVAYYSCYDGTKNKDSQKKNQRGSAHSFKEHSVEEGYPASERKPPLANKDSNPSQREINIPSSTQATITSVTPMTISTERNISKYQKASVISTKDFDKKSSKTSSNQSKTTSFSNAEVQTDLGSSGKQSGTPKLSSVGSYSSTNESLNRNQFQLFVRQIAVKPIQDTKKS